MTLREALETTFGPPHQASLSWQAKMPHDLSPDHQQAIMKLIHALEDLDDVQAIWTNADEQLKALRHNTEDAP